MNQISDSFEDLSHALRVLLEADYRANNVGLLHIDRAEAVGNIEIALAGVLNAFHSIYDAISKEGHADIIDWYKTPELATILVLRNARHHNQAKKIRTLYSYYLQHAEKIGCMEMYVLVDFPAEEVGGDTFNVFLSWADLKMLLDMPVKESRIPLLVSQSVREYLYTDRFKNHALDYALDEQRVFFNVVPLFVNAAIKIVPLIKTFITARSTESQAFLELFNDLQLSNTCSHEVNCGPVVLMP